MKHDGDITKLCNNFQAKDLKPGTSNNIRYRQGYEMKGIS